MATVVYMWRAGEEFVGSVWEEPLWENLNPSIHGPACTDQHRIIDMLNVNSRCMHILFPYTRDDLGRNLRAISVKACRMYRKIIIHCIVRVVCCSPVYSPIDFEQPEPLLPMKLDDEVRGVEPMGLFLLPQSHDLGRGAVLG